MKWVGASIVFGVAAISQHADAKPDQIRLVTAPNNEYALVWIQPTGPLRVVSAGNGSAETELDVSSFGQRFGEDQPTAVPLSFVSPDSTWLFVVAPPDSFANAPESFNRPALLFHRIRSEHGALHFQPAMPERFEKAAWEFLDRELKLQRGDVPRDAQRVYSSEFIDWSPDSGRLLMKISSGAWSPSKQEWVQSVYNWYCYFNLRSGEFELTDRLRSVDSKPELNGVASDDPGMMTIVTAAEPIGGEGPQPARKERFEQADKRLNDVYAKLLTKTEPAQREAVREEERAWLLSRDTQAQVEAIQAWSFGPESVARILENKTASTEARVVELEKRL